MFPLLTIRRRIAILGLAIGMVTLRVCAEIICLQIVAVKGRAFQEVNIIRDRQQLAKYRMLLKPNAAKYLHNCYTQETFEKYTTGYEFHHVNKSHEKV